MTVDRLRRWSKPGLLCIGDAAHAMSPVGGVGINLAIQDAVAAANLLAAPLRDGTLDADDLDAVRRRRLWPTKMTQAVQVAIQNNVLVPVLGGTNADPRGAPAAAHRHRAAAPAAADGALARHGRAARARAFAAGLSLRAARAASARRPHALPSASASNAGAVR